MSRAPAAAFILGTALLMSSASLPAEDIDPSDPTRVYTFLGGGIKYSDYTNGESMLEFRVTGNLGVDADDAILFEAGYGFHDGNLVPGSNEGLTNVRVRWFHLLGMDYELVRGYRGMGTQLDLQFAGQLKGTDGQNVIAAGVLPAWALDEEWNLYLFANAVGAWDKSFSRFNGAGVSVAPKVVFDTTRWWPGAQLQLMLEYKYFLSGELQNDGAGLLEFNVGGAITPTVTWDLIAQKNFDVDLMTFRRGRDTGLENDWNVFVNVTSFF